jgi:inorganic pyrophosphatase
MCSKKNCTKFIFCLVLMFGQGVCARSGAEVMEDSVDLAVKSWHPEEKFTPLTPDRASERTDSNAGENTVKVLVEIPMSAMPNNAPVPDQQVCPKPKQDLFEPLVLRDARELNRISKYTLVSSVHLVDEINPVAGKKTIRVVIEIPSGSTEKWEVEKPSGDLKWEFKHDQPRTVQYLGYPGNYGMVPKTLLVKDNGGDGDPLDVIVLGPAVPRGSVIEVKIIGLLRMTDKGEDDDKLIAVMTSGVFAKVDTIDDLEDEFPGVTDIVEIWFANYKGQNKIDTDGYVGRKKANKLLSQALDDYKKWSI